MYASQCQSSRNEKFKLFSVTVPFIEGALEVGRGSLPAQGGEGGALMIIHGRSRMTIKPGIPTMRGGGSGECEI